MIVAVAHRDRAEASALYLFSYYLGGSMAGALGGLVYSAGGWAATVWFVGVLLLAALLLMAPLSRPERRDVAGNLRFSAQQLDVRASDG